ncbi:hypothetical protein LEP1GSC170_1121 [Leptospira interrogans serovar Bataviae str. HAI135]|nr:hypothetical protein LEP1GSC170_1121 [Leptospira interrogans serovar Bataviae str. HAI135]
MCEFDVRKPGRIRLLSSRTGLFSSGQVIVKFQNQIQFL